MVSIAFAESKIQITLVIKSLIILANIKIYQLSRNAILIFVNFLF